MRFPFLLAALFVSSTARGDDSKAALKPGDSVPACAMFDPESAHSFKPHCRETLVRAGRKSDMSYNALGLRDKDYPERPKPGWTRILFVGSSRLAGPGIPEKSTPARRLESYLGGAAKKVEVINAGVEGYSPLLQASKIHAWIEAYHPTHVVLDLDFGMAASLDAVFTLYEEKDASGRPRVNVHIFPWMKPVVWLLGIDTNQYPGFRRVTTWQAAAYRMWRTLRCRVTTFNPATNTLCMSKPTLQALGYLRGAAKAAGAKTLFLIPSGAFTSSMWLSPAFDPGAFGTFDRFTPELMMNMSFIVKYFVQHRIEFKHMIPVQGEDLNLPNDYNLSEAGADLFARAVKLRLDGFLETGEGEQKYDSAPEAAR